MSKADQLGAGRFGGTRSVSARRQAVAAATGVPTEGIAPPTELQIHRISPNPDNPRSTLGDLTDLAGSLATHGQKQAITVMNRDAYVNANPEREADLEPDATHVVIDGSSRLAAAREAGLTALKVMVSDDQGATADEILESALVANIHRQDLEEMDEALALQRLLAIHGTQTALAKRLHRSQGWVSQRLALLNLTPELQQRIGQEPIDLLRAVGNKPAEQQQTALDELKAQRARAEAEKAERKRKQKEAPSAAPTATADAADRYYDVIGERSTNGDGAQSAGTTVGESHLDSSGTTVAPSTAGPETRRSAAPSKSQTESSSSRTVPEPRTAPRPPYNDGVALARELIREMDDNEFGKMLHLLNEHHEQTIEARRAGTAQ
ncbi:ParB/RepB/Spo0J family partition protein [Streptomyces sp. NPDC002004]